MRRLFGPFFVFAGIMHFVKTRWYEWIMPPYVPRHREVVYLSGVAEIAGGAGHDASGDSQGRQRLEHRRP